MNEITALDFLVWRSHSQQPNLNRHNCKPIIDFVFLLTSCRPSCLIILNQRKKNIEFNNLITTKLDSHLNPKANRTIFTSLSRKTWTHFHFRSVVILTLNVCRCGPHHSVSCSDTLAPSSPFHFWMYFSLKLLSLLHSSLQLFQKRGFQQVIIRWYPAGHYCIQRSIRWFIEGYQVVSSRVLSNFEPCIRWFPEGY